MQGKGGIANPDYQRVSADRAATDDLDALAGQEADLGKPGRPFRQVGRCGQALDDGWLAAGQVAERTGGTGGTGGTEARRWRQGRICGPGRWGGQRRGQDGGGKTGRVKGRGKPQWSITADANDKHSDQVKRRKARRQDACPVCRCSRPWPPAGLADSVAPVLPTRWRPSRERLGPRPPLSRHVRFSLASTPIQGN